MMAEEQNNFVEGTVVGAKTIGGMAVGAISGLTGALIAIGTAEIMIPVAFVVGTASLAGGAFGFNRAIDQMKEKLSGGNQLGEPVSAS
jgi:hypothetical protein